ncbi:phosphotransferase [Candidatus Halocynthiibacter alkanivorans]|uniref:phosphotransferase n=1 Tax=Candidatus Halocynthiibacter alkanivorans TaxID=2267619 RepID=UPI000DF3A5B4|nr:phosphotransferase [Candidatus Halocynthiibacter alkanivorans]
MELSKEALVEHASAQWPRMLQSLGKDPSTFQAVVLKSRLAGETSRILFLLKSVVGECFVFKAHFPISDLKFFQNQIASQRQAFEQMATEPGHKVPEILFVDETNRSLLMEYVVGPTVHHALKLELDHRHAVLEKAGAWIGAFHRTTYVRYNPVNPDVMLQSFAQITYRVEQRDIIIARRSEYLEYAAQVPAMAEAIRGQSTRISAVHGDLHLQNVVFGRNAVYGIDFKKVHQAPTAHDLSYFLVSFGMHFCTGNSDNAGSLFDPGDMDAFYRGYGEEHRDDPALCYLVPMRVLAEWRAVPKDKRKRSESERDKFHRLQRMARIVFES